jgi:hypothetical protein
MISSYTSLPSLIERFPFIFDFTFMLTWNLQVEQWASEKLCQQCSWVQHPGRSLLCSDDLDILGVHDTSLMHIQSFFLFKRHKCETNRECLLSRSGRLFDLAITIWNQNSQNTTVLKLFLNLPHIQTSFWPDFIPYRVVSWGVATL